MLNESGTAAEGGLVEGLLQSLLSDYAPASQTFDVTLPHGETIPFKRLYDSVAMAELQREATQWAKSMMPKKGKPPALLPGWEAVYTADAELLAKVYCVTKLAVHPDFQDQLGVLKLARKAGPIFQSIVHQIDLASVNLIAQNEVETVEAEKKA